MKNMEQRERVFGAADGIFAETGKYPTVAEVRARAGTDSNATTQFMREWRSAMDREARAGPTRAIPERLRRVVDALALAAWEEAEEIARGELFVEREDRKAESAREAALLQEVSCELDAKWGDLRAAQERITALEAAACARDKEIDDLREDLAAATREQASALARAMEAERRADLMNAEVARLHHTLAEERVRRAEELTLLMDGQKGLSALLNELIASASASTRPPRNLRKRRSVTAKSDLTDGPPGGESQLTLVSSVEGRQSD